MRRFVIVPEFRLVAMVRRFAVVMRRPVKTTVLPTLIARTLTVATFTDHFQLLLRHIRARARMFDHLSLK